MFLLIFYVKSQIAQSESGGNVNIISIQKKAAKPATEIYSKDSLETLWITKSQRE